MTELLNQGARAWWPWIAAASWQVALMVVLVGLTCLAVRRLSARLRYLLWLLVLIKIFTPPSLGTAWGVGQWLVRPAWRWTSTALERRAALVPQSSQSSGTDSMNLLSGNPSNPQLPALDLGTDAQVHANAAIQPPASLSALGWLWIAWALGAAVFTGWMLLRYAWMARLLRGASRIEEGPLCVALEKLITQLGVKSPPPALLVSDRVASPFLMGVLRPRIVLPADLAGQLTPEQLESVLLHELMHWRRRDLLVGWLQLPAQGLFWFHPLVWLAGAQLRHERECACDEAVLATGCAQPGDYGRSLLQVLLASGGRSSTVMGFLGIFERNTRLQRRLEEIMSQETSRKRPGAWGHLLVLLFTLVCLPMAPLRSQPAGDSGTKQQELRKRYFVLLVVGEKGEMTFQGEPATFDTLPAMFEKLPNRPHTVLEIARAGKNVPKAVMDAVWKKAYGYETTCHFEYLSQIGEHPLGSKAREPQTGFEYPERKFVRVVLDTQGNLTFEGRKTTREDLPALLKALPDPKNTALSVAVTEYSMIDTPETQKQEGEILALGSQAGIGFLGTIGAHPAGSYGVRDTTLYNGHLVKPVAVDIEQSPGGGPLTVGEAVAAICKAARLPFQRERSAAQAGPAARELTAPLHVKNTMPEKALLDVLNPVGLRFDLDGYGLFLYRPAPAGQDAQSRNRKAMQDAADRSKTMLAEIESLLDQAIKSGAETHAVQNLKARTKEYIDLLNLFYEKEYNMVLAQAPALKARVTELVEESRRKAAPQKDANVAKAETTQKPATAAPAKKESKFNLVIKTYDELVADQVAFHARNSTFSEQEVREYFKKQADAVQNNYGGRIYAYGYIESGADGKPTGVYAPFNGGRIDPAVSGPTDHITFYDNEGNLLVTCPALDFYKTQLGGGAGSNIPRRGPAWKPETARAFHFVFSVDPKVMENKK